MAEAVPRTCHLCGHVAVVISIDRRLESHPADDLNSGFGQTIELGRVVGKQDDACAFEHLEHARGNAIVAFIVIEAKRGVCVNGIESAILQPIGTHLVGKADAAALLRQIENNAAAEVLEARHCEPKLVAAVTAPRAKYITRQARRMQPHGYRLGEIGLPYNNRNFGPTHGVAEDNEASA